MSISTADVKALREATGAGMMDCKKALLDSDGDFAAATKLLRSKGLAAVGKRADRTAAEGLIEAHLSDDSSRGVMVEVSCETDFVAKGERFGELAANIAKKVFEFGTGAEVQAELAAEIERLIEAASIDLQEKIEYKGASTFETTNGVVAAYLHRAGGWAKKGVLVQLDGGEPEALLPIAYELAMHIQFARPEFLTADEVPAALIEAEREIAEARARNEGKPDQVVPRIAEGAVKKLYKERVLLDQPFVKDESKTISNWLAEVSGNARIARFAIFEIGGDTGET